MPSHCWYNTSWLATFHFSFLLDQSIIYQHSSLPSRARLSVFSPLLPSRYSNYAQDGQVERPHLTILQNTADWHCLSTVVFGEGGYNRVPNSSNIVPLNLFTGDRFKLSLFKLFEGHCWDNNNTSKLLPRYWTMWREVLQCTKRRSKISSSEYKLALDSALDSKSHNSRSVKSTHLNLCIQEVVAVWSRIPTLYCWYCLSKKDVELANASCQNRSYPTSVTALCRPYSLFDSSHSSLYTFMYFVYSSCLAYLQCTAFVFVEPPGALTTATYTVFFHRKYSSGSPIPATLFPLWQSPSPT